MRRGRVGLYVEQPIPMSHMSPISLRVSLEPNTTTTDETGSLSQGFVVNEAGLKNLAYRQSLCHH